MWWKPQGIEDGRVNGPREAEKPARKEKNWKEETKETGGEQRRRGRNEDIEGVRKRERQKNEKEEREREKREGLRSRLPTRRPPPRR